MRKTYMLKMRHTGSPNVGGGEGAMIGEDVSYTLSTGQDQTMFQSDGSGYVVRRLTPLECERLQGFPDGWTDLDAGSPLDDAEKARRVDMWFDDVSSASMRWETAKAAQDSADRVVAYLEEVMSRMRGAPQDLEDRMGEAVSRMRECALKCAETAERQAMIETEFNEFLEKVETAELAEAWRMRFTERKTWLQCSMALHYNRTHLERLHKQMKPKVYPMIPGRYQ